MKSKELEIYARCARCSMTTSGKVKPTHIFPNYDRINVPVLLICSSKDQLIYGQEYIPAAKKLGWKIVQLKHDDHILIPLKPKEVAEAIRKFL